MSSYGRVKGALVLKLRSLLARSHQQTTLFFAKFWLERKGLAVFEIK